MPSARQHRASDPVRRWPRTTRFEQCSFELLRRAYVDAGYSPQYTITDEEQA